MFCSTNRLFTFQIVSYIHYLSRLSVLRNFLSLRTTIHLVCFNFIYKFHCSSCNAFCCVKTARNLKIRCIEHLSVNISEQKIKTLVNSATLKDIGTNGRSASCNNFSITSQNSIPSDPIHESLLIHKDRPTFNSQQSSLPLVLF